MTAWTATQIDDLIACRKTIKDAPKKEMKEENRHRRNDMVVVSDAGEAFEVFIRQSLEFDEDFSVGLVYLSPEGRRIVLIRFNGQHEQTNDAIEAAKPHFNYHIHKVTADDLNEGRMEKHPAAVSTAYASLSEALGEFFTAIGLDGFERYFPEAVPLPLFKPGRPPS